MAKKAIKDEIDIAPVQSEAQDVDTPIQPYEILSYPADFTLEVLVDKWEKQEIKVPPLQRRYLWPIERASRLIESFLLGLPVPPIFVYKDEDEALLIVDGHQRLRSIVYFFSGKFGEDTDPDSEDFKLTGLGEKSLFQGVDFKTLEKTDSKSFNRLKNSVLRAFIMKQLAPNDDTSILAVFERLNTGGVTLQGQEIRNCIYEGTFNDLLKKLNKNADWRKIVGNPSEDKRMRDVELILRFLALFHNIERYQKPMKTFLHKFMEKNRRAPADPNPNDPEATKKAIATKQKEFGDKMEAFEKLFTETASVVVKYLGPKPFRVSGGLNAAVFDSAFSAFARHLDKAKKGQSSASYIDRVKAKYRQLLKNKQYTKWVSAATTDKDVVPQRIDKAEKLLFG